MEDTSPTSDVSKLTELYKPIAEGTKKIRENTERIKSLKEKEKNTVPEKERKKIIDQVSTLFNDSHLKAKALKTELESIKSQNDLDTAAADSTTSKIKQNLYMKHAKDLQSAMESFQSESEDFKSNLQDRTRRELETAGVKPQDIESVIESGKADQILREVMISGNVEDLVSNISSRHAQILHLEQQVMEVHQLFLDLAHLVSYQGETIDVIDRNITKTKQRTENAAEQIRIGEDYQKKSRKRQCTILFLIFAVLLIILLPTIIVSTKSS